MKIQLYHQWNKLYLKIFEQIEKSYIKCDPGPQVLSCWGMFVAIAKNTLYGLKYYLFSFMPKIIRISSKDQVP